MKTTRTRLFYVLVFCAVARLSLQTLWSLGSVHSAQRPDREEHAMVDHLHSNTQSIGMTTTTGVAPASAPAYIPTTSEVPSKKSPPTDAPVLRPTRRPIKSPIHALSTISATTHAVATADSALAQPRTHHPLSSDGQTRPITTNTAFSSSGKHTEVAHLSVGSCFGRAKGCG
jgi:hypothetical protein